jgi:hypothetical protein|tara:strand:+ start:781 stop:972 length:192 start_codon:yes stop_codon:yes gene_type:complete
MEELKEYIKRMDKSHNDFLFDIYTSGDNEHIRNIRIGGIDQLHKYANLGLLYVKTIQAAAGLS